MLFVASFSDTPVQRSKRSLCFHHCHPMQYNYLENPRSAARAACAKKAMQMVEAKIKVRFHVPYHQTVVM